MSKSEDCPECHGSTILRDDTLLAPCPHCIGGKIPEAVYIVKTMQNLTACDTVFKGGSTQRLLAEDIFATEEAARAFYNKMRNSFAFAGLAGQYVTYPVREENYTPTTIPTKYCDSCGAGIPEDDDAYTDIGGDYCSKSCFRNNFQANDDYETQYDDRYEDDY